MEASKEEQRAVIRFLTAEGESAAGIHRRMLAVYGEHCLCESAVRKWSARYHLGRTSVKDDPRPGQAHVVITEENCAAVDELIRANRRITKDEIANTVGISHGSVHTIIHERLAYRKVCAQWVPRHLSEEQKAERVRLCQQHLSRYEKEGDEFLNRIVTGDESWCHHYEPETRRSSMQWKHVSSPPPKKFKTEASAGKVMLSFFFDHKGPMLVEFLEHGRTINAEQYVITLGNLRTRIKNKRPGLLTKGVILLHDNARPHTAKVTKEKLTRFRWEILEQPAYSPDLSPCDFHIFGDLKKNLKGRKFPSDAAVQEAVCEWVRSQPKEFFEQGIRRLVSQWKKCLANHGDY